MKGDATGVHWLAAGQPVLAACFGSVGVAFWIAWAFARRRVRRSGL